MQVFVEFRDHLARLQALAVGPQTLGPDRDVAQQREVGIDHGQHVRPQHLHRDVLARMLARLRPSRSAPARSTRSPPARARSRRTARRSVRRATSRRSRSRPPNRTVAPDPAASRVRRRYRPASRSRRVDSTWPNLTKIGPRLSSASRNRMPRGTSNLRPNVVMRIRKRTRRSSMPLSISSSSPKRTIVKNILRKRRKRMVQPITCACRATCGGAGRGARHGLRLFCSRRSTRFSTRASASRARDSSALKASSALRRTSCGFSSSRYSATESSRLRPVRSACSCDRAHDRADPVRGRVADQLAPDLLPAPSADARRVSRWSWRIPRRLRSSRASSPPPDRLAERPAARRAAPRW